MRTHNRPPPPLIKLPAGIKTWLAGATSIGVKSVGSQIKLGASLVAGKLAGGASRAAAAGDGGADDFTISAGRSPGQVQVPTSVRVADDAWQQVRTAPIVFNFLVGVVGTGGVPPEDARQQVQDGDFFNSTP